MKIGRSKYFAQKTEYKGRIFDSKAEAKYAEFLDTLTHAKEDKERVTKIEYQVPFKVFINEIPVFTYVSDFIVEYADGRQEVLDVKGYRKGPAYSMFKLKKKCVEAYYGIEIKEVYAPKKVSKRNTRVLGK